MNNKKYEIIINNGINEGFEVLTLNKKDFIFYLAGYLRKPKKIFLGMGDFLEIGDFNNLIDTVLLDNDVAKLEGVLDKNNRKLSEEGEIPFSFFKLAVYYPDFLLKDVPVECVSIIGKKARLFPGAEIFTSYISEYNPLILTAIPFDISVEYVKRLGLSQKNLISTEYKKTVVNNKPVFSGEIMRFISANRRIIEIEKIMAEMNLREDDVLYIGRGEAGSSTFSFYNSIAFNPSKNIIDKSRISLYGSTLESLLVFFNFNSEIEKHLLSEEFEENLPSLVVLSNNEEKSEELINIELEHRQLQENVIGLKIEHSEDSYVSLEREINILLGASTINMSAVRDHIFSRMQQYIDDPQNLVKLVYNIARERYKSFSKS
ncbi:MAG: hypothetical protein WDA74_04480 [Spirochaetota bacterium]